jgi:signal transduction histidine kinase
MPKRPEGQALSSCDAEATEAKRRSRTREQTQQGKGCVTVIPAGDTPAFRCPGCGRTVPKAVEAVANHERFLERVFDRQKELQQSLAAAIHDELIQRLAGALLYFEGARQMQGAPRDEGPDNYRIGLKLLRDAIHESRRIAGRLATAGRRQS